MNKARMTFRFDEKETGRPESRDEYASPAMDVDHTAKQKTGADETPPTSSLVLDLPLETWGEPFQSQSQLSLPVIPETKDKIYAYADADTAWEETKVSSDDVYYISPRRPSRWKLAGSITAAVVTGTLFGFVVLSLFNKDVSLSIPGLTAVKGSGSQTAVSVFGSQDNEEDQDAAVPAVKVMIPDQAYYFLQYGVFSTSQGVKQAQEELQKSGIAAARDTLDNKRVYAGVSPEREQAKMLSSQLKSDGVNLIVHEILYPASAEMHYGGDIGTLDQYLEDSTDLVKLLSMTSASLLDNKDSKKQSAEEVANLKEKHRAWTENSLAVQRGLTADAKEVSAGMGKLMNTAVKALDEYNNNGSKTHLWEVQTAMMEYILLQKKLLGIDKLE